VQFAGSVRRVPRFTALDAWQLAADSLARGTTHDGDGGIIVMSRSEHRPWRAAAAKAAQRAEEEVLILGDAEGLDPIVPTSLSFQNLQVTLLLQGMDGSPWADAATDARWPRGQGSPALILS
jgi:hypothetical protein